MVLSMIFDKYLDLSEAAALLFAGIILVLLGGAHVLQPASSTLGMILGASNDLMSVTGIATRVIGVFVVLAGLDVFSDAY